LSPASSAQAGSVAGEHGEALAVVVLPPHPAAEIKIVTTHCAIGKPRMIDVQGSVSWHVRPSKDAPHRTGW